MNTRAGLHINSGEKKPEQIRITETFSGADTLPNISSIRPVFNVFRHCLEKT